MAAGAVIERLGAPTRSTTLPEVLAEADADANSVSFVDPDVLRDAAQEEYWLYVDVPPGHDTQIVIRNGVVASVQAVTSRKDQDPAPRGADRAVPAQTEVPSAEHSALTAILDEIVTAVGALPPVSSDDISDHYNQVELAWGVEGILTGNTAKLRRILAGVLSRNLREGFEVVVKTPDEPFPCVRIDAIGLPTAATAGRPSWQPYIVVKPTPEVESPPDFYALYGHRSLYIGIDWRGEPIGSSE
ncbi:hypothetical protein [Cryptosporangium aurantiacum]|nr:hypothetical protein [Cryptosporangium aurantiacum]